MAMRQDCKHFESRTFDNGDTISKCTLNLAPEAPWRCPPDCVSYERRRVAVNLSHQDIAKGSEMDAPDSLTADDSSIGDLLEDVASIVDSAAPEIVAEVEKEGKRGRGLAKMFRRKGGSGGSGGKRGGRRKNP